MSDDELEKLAMALKNISPSKKARKDGMAAAMAAFDTEFEAEVIAEKETSPEKISTSTQGLTDAPRPTGQSAHDRHVQTFGRDMMAKLKDIFSFNSKTAMMMGSCAAALFAVSLYVPNMTFEDRPTMSEAVTAGVEVDNKMADAEVPTVDAPTLESSPVETPEKETGDVESPAAPEAPVTESPIVDRPVTEVKPSEVVAEPTESKTDLAVAEAPVTEGPITVSPVIVGPSTSDAETVLPSDTVVIERRVLKAPARTMERVVPAVPKTVTRRVRKEDGSFGTVTEFIVVQEAATELVTIPPVYETVRETVRIGADGSTEILNSETIGDKGTSIPATVDINSISDLLSKVRSSDDVIISHEKADESRKEASFEALGDSRGSLSAPPAPAPEAIASLEGMAVTDEIVVTGAKRSKSSSRRSRRDAAEIAPAPVMAATPSPAIMSEPPTAPDIPATSRLVERAIPAITKTVTRRVIKTPASTMERVVPAITEDVTVQVLTEDGTYKNVTKTFVIQEASVELVTIPPVYETVTESVPVESGTEMVVIHADGTVEPWPPVAKPKPQPEPQSGLLTAGDYDDVLNPDLYKVYLDKMLQGPLKNKDLPYVDTNNRINIRVVDSAGNSVPLADIVMRTRNNKKMFPLRTGADGMAYLYPEYDGLERGTRLRVSVGDSKRVRKTISSKMVREGGDIEVVLDTENAPRKNLDLLLTIDATGSMGDEMRYLQTELEAILGRVERTNPGINIRTGLVVYRDVGDDYIVREVPFTDNLDDFREALNAQNANGGGDTPEAMHMAMQTGLEMDWREDAIKINLLVADAPPHDKYINKTWETGLKSRTRGIHVVPLAASGVDKTAEFLMRSMAQITGGRFLFLTDDSGIGNPHAKPTVDCYIVTRLDGLVTRAISSLVNGERVEPQPGEVIRSVGNYRSGICAVDEDVIEALAQNVSYQKR